MNAAKRGLIDRYMYVRPSGDRSFAGHGQASEDDLMRNFGAPIGDEDRSALAWRKGRSSSIGG
jgi:hypothetical protein